MKKILSLLFSALILSSFSLAASAVETDQVVEYLAEGSYFVTEIENESPGISLFSSSVTKSKTRTHYSASGSAQWYVKVTGTFTYGDDSSKCTSASVSARSYVSNWSISSKSSSKSGNKATATATADQLVQGQVLRSVTDSVTLTCSSTGVFS